MNQVHPLTLLVNDEQKQQLQAYGRVFRHEVYRVAGVFHKQQRVFAFPYRYLCDELDLHAKRQVVLAAARYDRAKQLSSHAKLDYIAVWPSDALILDELSRIHFPLGRKEGVRSVIIPFEGDEEVLRRLAQNLDCEVVLKQCQDHWLAYVETMKEKTMLF